MNLCKASNDGSSRKHESAEGFFAILPLHSLKKQYSEKASGILVCLLVLLLVVFFTGYTACILRLNSFI